MYRIVPQDLVQGVLFDFGQIPLKHCSGCGRDLPETSEFWHRKSGGKEFRLPCKSCRHDEYLVHSKEIIQKQRDAFLAKSPEEQEAIRTHQNKARGARSVKRRQQGMCSSCIIRPALIGNLCEQCCQKLKRYGDELRDQVLAAYGGKCTQCGESHPAFLSVDHVGDDGADHRRTVGGGHRLYRWLRKNGFPKAGSQLLCNNCNWLKQVSQKPIEKTSMMLWHANLRQETLAAYGGKCACCGEDRPEVLTIDHVHNDGNEHRRQVGAGGAFYS